MHRRATGLVAVLAVLGVLATVGVTAVPPAVSAAETLCGESAPPMPAALVGAPREDLPGAVDAGAVHLVTTNDDGTFTEEVALLTASDLGVMPAAGDRFGAATVLGFDEDSCPVVVVGAPGWNEGRGRVFVVKLTSTGYVTTVLEQGARGVYGAAEAGDGFGSSLTWGYSSDQRAYLAVGAPTEDLGSGASKLTDAGLVQVFDTAGPDAWGTSDYILTQDTEGVPGGAEAGDRFGAALSLTADGLGLAVGSPGEAIGAVPGAGSVTLIGADPGAFPLAGPSRGIQQDSKGVPGGSEPGDAFGSSLAVVDVGSEGVLVIGAPGEDIGTTANAGTVVVRYADGSYGALTQGSAGVTGKAEKGDGFGSVLGALPSTLVVGVPGEDVGTLKNAGLVHTFIRGGTSPYPLSGAFDYATTEDSAGVVGAPNAAERFGAALAFGTGNLWVGAPGETVASAAKAGLVYRFTSGTTSLAYRDRASQAIAGWGESGEAGDGFGGSLAAAG